jgi:predicted 3-demethylubiquinone-9 3-methyltransferase (glyoxalase superfamily)
METIIPYLWYDSSAREAAELYVSAFKDASILSSSMIEGTPSGRVETMSIRLLGQDFFLMSAGPYFKFNPSISLMVTCGSPAEVDELWAALSPGGKALMPLGSYPFSDRYGWTEDRFGLSWQLYYSGKPGAARPIMPTFMFTGKACGKAEEAMSFWASLFPQSSVADPLRYGPDESPDAQGSVKHGEFSLASRPFAAMDSAYQHGFGFNEAVSLMARCDTQAEIDRLWAALSADPEAERCGWLKDRYGLSWQIVPRELEEMMGSGDPERTSRVTKAFLEMGKLDVGALRKAYAG